MNELKQRISLLDDMTILSLLDEHLNLEAFNTSTREDIIHLLYTYISNGIIDEVELIVIESGE